MLTFRGSVPCLDDVPKPKDGTEKNGRKTLRLGRSQESHAEFGSAHVDEDEGTKGSWHGGTFILFTSICPLCRRGEHTIYACQRIKL